MKIVGLTQMRWERCNSPERAAFSLAQVRKPWVRDILETEPRRGGIQSNRTNSLELLMGEAAHVALF